ncbi:MAG: TrmH family RNA methyltransferase [Nitriliruptoraceae bacterium]
MDVTSARNPRLRAAAELLRARDRRERGLHLAEGPTVVAEALAHGDVVEVFATPEHDGLGTGDVPRLRAPATVLARLSDAVTPPGVVAVVRTPDTAAPLPEHGTVLVLDGVADPGNGGTRVRAAAALGAAAVVAVGPSADPFGPKAVRASAGTCYRLPVLRRADLTTAAAELRASGRRVVGLAAGEGDAVGALAGRGDVALVLGSEAHGVSDRGVPDAWAHVPMPGAVESLNVGAAGAIALHALLGPPAVG